VALRGELAPDVRRGVDPASDGHEVRLDGSVGTGASATEGAHVVSGDGEARLVALASDGHRDAGIARLQQGKVEIPKLLAVPTADQDRGSGRRNREGHSEKGPVRVVVDHHGAGPGGENVSRLFLEGTFASTHQGDPVAQGIGRQGGAGESPGDAGNEFHRQQW
jgi:hypothetical protein